MSKVYLYYEENYGKLLCECEACSNMHLFKSKDKAKQQIISTLKRYAGVNGDLEGCNRFYVDKEITDKAGLVLEDNVKLTDDQIITIADTTFSHDNSICIALYADESENWSEYFIICCTQQEIE